MVINNNLTQWGNYMSNKVKYHNLPIRTQLLGIIDLFGGSMLVCMLSVDGVFDSNDRMVVMMDELIKHKGLTDSNYSELIRNVNEGNF